MHKSDKIFNKLVKLTCGRRKVIEIKNLSIMEGVINTVSGMKRAANSPVNSPESPGFMKISPLKDLSYVKTPTDRPFRVSVEGNIGAGKSTLIKYFEKIDGIETYPEPIEWWRNLNGHNLLDLLYSDINKWYIVFQSYVQLTRLKTQTTKPKSPSTTVQIFERSLQNNRFCFMEQAYKNGGLHPADYGILDQWYKYIKANVDISLDLIVYLRSTPENVFNRVKARGRPEETSVSLEYLKQLHDSHEEWLMNENSTVNTIPVLVLDADRTLDEIVEQYKLNEHKILGLEKKDKPIIPQENKEKIAKKLKFE